MKGIKKTFMAGILACATFNVHAEESSGLSYGIKGGIGTSSAVGYGSKVELDGKKVTSSFFDTLVGFGTLYGEYAFTDYIGAGLEVGYMRQGASLTAEKASQTSNEGNKEGNREGDKENAAVPSISMVSHGIVVPFYLCIYPLGREEEEGILKIMLGGAPYIRFQPTYKRDGKELTLTDEQKKESQSYDMALTGGIGYEFPFGLSIEAKYSYGFVNTLKIGTGKEQTVFEVAEKPSVKELKEWRMQNVTFGVGYNFASLFSR